MMTRFAEICWDILYVVKHSFSESVFEALPQFGLQLFIVLLRFQAPNHEQLVSILSSLASISLAHINKYIDTHVKKGKKLAIIKYFPIFFLNSTFRVTAATITVLFFRSFSLVILFVYSSSLKMILNLYGRSKKVVHKKEFSRQLMESICQSFVTNTNLENSATSKYCRKVTFYFNLFFHILQLLLIFLMTKFVQEDKNVPFWGNIPLTEDKHTVLVFGVITAVGILSAVLDLFYYYFDSGVFYSSKIQIGEKATLHLSVKSTETNLPSCGKNTSLTIQ